MGWTGGSKIATRRSLGKRKVWMKSVNVRLSRTSNDTNNGNEVSLFVAKRLRPVEAQADLATSRSCDCRQALKREKAIHGL